MDVNVRYHYFVEKTNLGFAYDEFRHKILVQVVNTNMIINILLQRNARSADSFKL